MPFVLSVIMPNAIALSVLALQFIEDLFLEIYL
jgi:hypothetical protein